MEGLAKPQEVAAYLNISRRTLDNWASLGRGPEYIKIDGARRYEWTVVRAWIEERKVRHG